MNDNRVVRNLAAAPHVARDIDSELHRPSGSTAVTLHCRIPTSNHCTGGANFQIQYIPLRILMGISEEKKLESLRLAESEATVERTEIRCWSRVHWLQTVDRSLSRLLTEFRTKILFLASISSIMETCNFTICREFIAL